MPNGPWSSSQFALCVSQAISPGLARDRPGGRVNGPYTWAQPQVRGGSHTDTCAGSKAVDRTYQIAHRARTMLRENVEKKIGPVMMDAFPFAGRRCERLTEAVLKRLDAGT